MRPGQSQVRLDSFDPRDGLDRGKPIWIEALWYFLKIVFFLSPLPFPSRFKRGLLRLFGASIGKGVVIKPRVNIHMPWRLCVGDHAWIGEEVFILNFAEVTIGAHCCISQRAFLCTGNHDYRSPQFSYRNAQIRVEAEAWVGAQCFVGPGVTIGRAAVVTAGSVATQNLPPNMICQGNPAQPIRQRWTDV